MVKAQIDRQGKVGHSLDGRMAVDEPPQPGTAEWSEEWSQAQAFLKALGEMPDAFLHCRAFRHAWDVLRPFHDYERLLYPEGHAEPVWHIRQVLQCGRCSMLRNDFFLTYKRAGITRLEKVDMTYEMPPGDVKYYIGGAAQGVKPQEIVLAAMYERAMRHVAHANTSDREHAEA